MKRTPFEKTLADALSIGQEVIAVCGNITCRCVVEIDLHRIARHVGIDHPLLPRRGERHYSERLMCPECYHRGAYIWLGEATKLIIGDVPGLDLVIFGCVLILVVAFAPRGIAGLLRRHHG